MYPRHSLLAVSCWLILSAPLAAQGTQADNLTTHATQADTSASSGEQSKSSKPPFPAGRTIDGAKNPEQIPEERVILLLMTEVWKLPPNADAATERTFKRSISRMKLKDRDVEVLRGELQRVNPMLASQRQHLLDSARGGDGQQYLAGYQTFTATAKGAYARILEFMSADGRQKLRAYVEAFKTEREDRCADAIKRRLVFFQHDCSHEVKIQ